jgi:hypothetical protein
VGDSPRIVQAPVWYAPNVRAVHIAPQVRATVMNGDLSMLTPKC